MKTYFSMWLALALLFAANTLGDAKPLQAKKPMPVTLEKTADGWRLLRDGKPYFIKGAGGGNNLTALVAAGGNSCRTWGDENAAKLLDQAEKMGLTVTVGVWVGHIEHGFKYDDPNMVKGQLEAFRSAVRRLKDHPALLMWGIGNEMEIGGSGENPALWRAIDEIVQMIKTEDPNHPAMTVVAEISKDKIIGIKKYAPHLEVLGVNAYGGLPSLAARLKEFGWDKPFAVTEFGPRGPWETAKTAWGAPREDTSTVKGRLYAENYAKVIAANRNQCLGSYCFLWDSKMEATPTWFGMFLYGSGERLAPVEAMTLAWGGKILNRVPVITAFTSDTDGKEIAPGSEQQAAIETRDADKDGVRVVWQVRADTLNRNNDPGLPYPPDVPGAILKSDARSVTFKAPLLPGAYRLYAFVFDDKGNAATANFPFLVK